MFKVQTFFSRPYTDANYKEYEKRRNYKFIVVESSGFKNPLSAGSVLFLMVLFFNVMAIVLLTILASVFNWSHQVSIFWAATAFIIIGVPALLIHFQPKIADLKHGSYYSLNAPTWALTSTVHSKDVLWRKIEKELTPSELENFEGILPSFEGSIKELVAISKTI